MKLPEEGMLLRILIGETDSYKSKALYEQIVLKARELNLAGATVVREPGRAGVAGRGNRNGKGAGDH
jgi:PII-like signaling protein